MANRVRLDQLLVARGHAPTRSRAADAIRRGAVRIAGERADKPGALVKHDCAIEIDDPASRYVSRAALKLVHALDRFELSPAGLACLDLGASTGGFTQVLLERGARRVYAVDVGHGQLHDQMAADPHVVSLEGLNARELTKHHIPERVAAIVADVSFISLRLVLPPALMLAAGECWLALLVKPQFEVGREAIGKGGIVKDRAAAEASVMAIVDLLDEAGWRVLGYDRSPITGSDGNVEYVLAARRSLDAGGKSR